MTEYQKGYVQLCLDKVFEVELKQYQKQIDAVINDNDVLLGAPTMGFNHLGVNYGREGQKVVNCPSLKLPLSPRMNELVRFRKSMEFDKQMIQNVLIKLIEPCITLQDMRDALPECLAAQLGQLFITLSRTREPAWPIQGNAMAMRQYQKALTKIEAYCAMKYLY